MLRNDTSFAGKSHAYQVNGTLVPGAPCMIATEIRSAVRTLQAQSHSLREISRLLKLSRNTVRRILRKPDRTEAPPCGEATLVRVKAAFARASGNVVRMQQLLAREDLAVPYSTLTRWIRKTGLHRPRPLIAAQQWLTEVSHGARSVDLLQKEIHDCSDINTLVCKIKTGRQRERKKALTILAGKRGLSNTTISSFIHSSPKTIRRYIELYNDAGAETLFRSCAQHFTTPTIDSEKTKRLLEILHQKPASFNINRTSWTHRALIQAYKERHNETVSIRTIKRLIKNAGYSWKKARRVLTSPDPNYTEKVELLSRTILSLSENELFFFVDEWGPVQVRKRGGSLYSSKHAIPMIPRHQVSKGTVALVAALSATTNQITWAFTISKDTLAMTDLLEILYNQHQACTKLYVTWDAVSWHNSTALTDWLDQFNEITRRQAAGPIIELVPLPTSAQFLNVIEGVLSGMTRAVVNNSDYSCPGDMKIAISRHFNDRNQHFQRNPRRAGKAIWNVDLFHGFDAFRVEEQ